MEDKVAIRMQDKIVYLKTLLVDIESMKECIPSDESIQCRYKIGFLLGRENSEKWEEAYAHLIQTVRTNADKCAWSLRRCIERGYDTESELDEDIEDAQDSKRLFRNDIIGCAKLLGVYCADERLSKFEYSRNMPIK